MKPIRAALGLRGHTAVALTATALLLAGCLPGAQVGGVSRAGAAYQEVAPVSLPPGSVIPAPSGETVLTISGAIEAPNAEGELRLDLPTLERLGLVTYTVADPWRKRTVAYTGVLLADLLTYAKVSSSATTLHLVALDDYEAEIAVADARRWPIMLATRDADGVMPVEDGGPTRIVFPYHAYPRIDTAVYNNQWIWSIKSVEVR